VARPAFAPRVPGLAGGAAAGAGGGPPGGILAARGGGGGAVPAGGGEGGGGGGGGLLGPPADPGHVTGLFRDRLAEIGERGEVEVTLAGGPVCLRRPIVGDNAEQKLQQKGAPVPRGRRVISSPTGQASGGGNATLVLCSPAS